MGSFHDENNNTQSYAIWQNISHNEIGLKALHLAADKGHESNIRCLVQHGDSVNEPTSKGRTALCIASFRGFYGIAAFLCESNADVNKCCNNGWTCLMSASLKGHIKVTELLFQYEVDVNACTRCGYTALMIASENGHLDILEQLIQHNARIDAKTISPFGEMQRKQIVKTDQGIIPHFSVVNNLNYKININEATNVYVG